MPDDVWDYFKEKYSNAGFRVVPGHHPNFQTKDEVDKWFKVMEGLMMNERKCIGGLTD